jgi:hypothetical protein
MQEVFERRFRWMARQVVATVDETRRLAASEETKKRPKAETAVVDTRLDSMRGFFATLDAGISAFSNGESFGPDSLRSGPTPPRVVSMRDRRKSGKSR